MEREVKIFNPKYSKSLINKTVEITTVNGKIHNGIVYVVDPISESVVTVTKDQEKCNVNIFMGKAIQSLRVCSNKENTADYFTIKTYKNDAELNEKKILLKSWLEKNLFVVAEDGFKLQVGQDLTIEPPYDNAHCFSSNAIVLQRIKDIINKMPDTT